MGKVFMKANDPAFPCEEEKLIPVLGTTVNITHKGMDLRTHIATQIVSGIAANFHVAQSRYDEVTVAKLAIKYADALMNELDNSEEVSND